MDTAAPAASLPVATVAVQPAPPRPAGITATLRIGLIATAAVLLIWLLSSVVLLVFMAILLAAILRGLADWLHHHARMPRMLALALVTIVVLGCIVALGVWSGPRFLNEGQALWKQLSGEWGQLRQTYGNTPWGKALFGMVGPSNASGNGGGIAKSAERAVTSTVGFIAALFVLLVTALYFAINPDMYVNGAVALMPLPRRPRAREILIEMGHTLQWWSLGQSIDMAVVGLLSWIGLHLLGVPLALALAVIAGLLTFIPYFGPIISAVPAVLVAISVSWSTALWTVGVFLICHGVEGYIVAPLVQKRTVELPPAVTILGMSILGSVFGALGIIMATPLTAVLLVLVREAYVRDVLGDHTTGAPSTSEHAHARR